MSTKRGRCFVIMPFSQTTKEHTEEYWTKHFESFLKPLIEECKLEAQRSEPLREDILRKIITELVVCPIVVADITDGNLNVFWELGVRQSFKHGTITIAEEGTKIPFDVSVKSTLLYYPKDHIKNAKFCKKFKKAIKDCLSRPDSPDSQVLETISGRGTLFEVIHRDELTRRVKALISECKRNTVVSKYIYKTIEKNQKNPEKRKFVTRRFRSPAVEALITERYLDEKNSFYELAEKYFEVILIRNEQLGFWEQSPDITEEWFLSPKTKELFARNSEKYRKELDIVQKKLSASR